MWIGARSAHCARSAHHELLTPLCGSISYIQSITFGRYDKALVFETSVTFLQNKKVEQEYLIEEVASFAEGNPESPNVCMRRPQSSHVSQASDHTVTHH